MSNWTVDDLPPPPPGASGWPWTEGSPPSPALPPGARQWPRISIVTPSYNQGRFLEEAIRSVLLQGYPDLEYIAMDGGSSDESVAIIHKYQRYLTYWASDRDRGQSHAINKGFARSSGDVLAWLNSDDSYTPGALFRAADALLREPQAGLVYSDAFVRAVDVGNDTYRRGGPIDTLALVRDGCVIPQPTAFLRRTVLEQAGLLDENLHFALDYDLWLRCSLIAPIQHLAGLPLATESRHAAQKSLALQHRFWPEIRLVLRRLFEQNGLPPHVAAERRPALARAYYMSARGAFLGGRDALRASVWWACAVGLQPEYLVRLPLALLRGAHRGVQQRNMKRKHALTQ